MGSSDATVTIMAFGDFQCNLCKDWFLNDFPEIKENFIDTGKVNLVFINAKFLGDDSLPASIASYCADEQGKYWEYHGLLYTNQQGVDDGWANSERLKAFAFDLKLDMEIFESCLDSGKYENKVKTNVSKVQNNGITGIPAFVIINSEGGHHIIKGSSPYPVFEKVIKSFI